MSEWIGNRTIDVELADGAKYTARTLFADSVHYETAARKHGWGAQRDNLNTATAFVAWSALRRDGQLDRAVTYDAFRDRLAAVRPVDPERQLDDDDDEGPNRPTRPGQQPG